MDFVPAWVILPAAFLLDLCLGDPRFLPHPVRWMGSAIENLEPPFRKLSLPPAAAGAIFAAVFILGAWVATELLLLAAQALHPAVKITFEIILIYYCLSARSLQDAAMDVSRSLAERDLRSARSKVALIVGRDVDNYQADGVARAAVETVSENLVDGVISPLFFAAIGGAPAAMAYKMANTLDSMIGYKNETYLHFGRAAAWLDDVFNYVPARLSIPIIALAAQVLSGNGRRAFETAVKEGANHSSPNAGLPEAAFAGALAVRLNGPNTYNGKLVDKPYIGIRFGKTRIEHIKKSCDIMMLSSILWLGIVWGIKTVFSV
jgi:adenosylcobinamide-phosphate synthase